MNKQSDPTQISILVRLHAILRTIKQAEHNEGINLVLPEAATISDAVRLLELPQMELVYSLNASMVGEETTLKAGDELDIIPAISGGGGQLISISTAIVGGT